MKRNCRLIVNLACNYSCPYCCNKIEGMLDKFTPIDLKDLMKTIAPYDNVCLSGGEPLIPSNIELVQYIAMRLKEMGKKVFVYTNLSCTPTHALVTIVDGWSVGFHPDQVDVEEFISRYIVLKAMKAKNVRVLAEDDKAHLLTTIDPRVVKTWKRNDCDKTSIEDWYILDTPR